jgi:fatty acid synthesis protein
MNKQIAKVFEDIANAIESGSFAPAKRVALTTLGSEHGEGNLLEGALLAKKLYPKLDIALIGKKNDTGLLTYEVNSEEEMYKVMEEKLDSKEISACVTMHYNFPIGVSTVGRVSTPAKGKELILATTTGTSSSNRVEAMVKNAIAGIITAKSLGVENPSLGILNLDGARTAEKILKEIAALGYNINFSESKRADGGVVMRGNDLLLGTPDVMVTDSLTGNVLMKMFSSFTSGGEYEVSGYGYGPGVGEGFKRNILIISRASGAPVIANALKYAFDISNGDIEKHAETEYQSLAKLNWQSVIDKYTAKKETKTAETKVEAPSKEAVTEQISGVDVMDIDDAVQMLWKAGIYAEGGMGCTGPVVLVNAAKFDKALELIKKEGFASAQ